MSADFFAPVQGGLPPAGPPLSAAVRVGDLVFTAGQVANDERGDMVGEGDVAAQTEQVLRNVEAALGVAGATMADVVKVTVWLRDVSDFAAMNEVYARWFPEPRPVRACVRAELMGSRLLVEIEATAAVG